ncbi:ClpP/crotonase [Neoconidiobolus thromboides FSU 785]|nr:ClpP/crotonase [Neoconidiobolus thromboides FSU 785]
MLITKVIKRKLKLQSYNILAKSYYSIKSQPIQSINLLKDIREQFRSYGQEGSSKIELDIDSNPSIITITLNNPKSYNAFTGKMMAELADVVDTIETMTNSEDTSYVGLILCGKGSNFCSGLDLGIAKEELTTSSSGNKLSLLMQNTLERLNQLPLISVAAINGYALGGGAETSTCTDFRVGSQDSNVSFVHRKIATVPGWGGGKRLMDLMGNKKALYYIASAKSISHEDQQFFDKIVEKGKAVEGAIRFLNKFIYDPNGSLIRSQNVRNIKKLMNNLKGTSNESERLKIETMHFNEAWGSEANLLAVQKANKKK